MENYRLQMEKYRVQMKTYRIQMQNIECKWKIMQYKWNIIKYKINGKYRIQRMKNFSVRIRVRIDPIHPLVCRKRRLDGEGPSDETGKSRSNVTAGVAR
jgi:hypothetical protein